MIIQISIVAIAAAVFIFFLRLISQYKASNMNSLSNQRQKVESRYEFMIKQKKELKKELEEKQRQLTTLQNNQEGIKVISAADLEIDDLDESEKIAHYLIQQGKISLEQNERALQKMNILKMDYLAVCIALGFIDIETGNKALKANKIQLKSIKK